MRYDARLSPDERRRWDQLQRQLEAEISWPTGTPSSPIRVALPLSVVLLLTAAVAGGAVAVVAVGAYLSAGTVLWGLVGTRWRA